MAFNSANIELLKHMQNVVLPDGMPRFVTVGSLGRTAALGATIAEYDTPNPNRFHDVDAIDRLGILKGKFIFPSGAVLDTGLTMTSRPSEEMYDTWMFLDAAADGGVIGTVPQSSLGLHMVHQGDINVEVGVMAPQAFFAFECIVGALTQRLPKHHAQMRDLETKARTTPVDMEFYALERVLGQAERAERERSLTAYTHIRKKIFDLIPSAGLFISEGNLGALIRSIRKTQSITYEGTFEELFSTTHQNSKLL